MKLSITFEQNEIEAVKSIIEEKLAQGRRMVTVRLQNNVEGPPRQINDDALWMVHIMCLLTTQQRSGPDSPIKSFLYREPFPLTLTACREFDDVYEATFQMLTEAKGIRRTSKVAKAMKRNLESLEDSEWENLRTWRDRLLTQRAVEPHPSHRQLEEEAANYVTATFHEFGPKQSRNFWQSLGLTRYVFVLDSRIMKWLRTNLGIQTGLLSSSALSDPDYYAFVSDLLLELCLQADSLPCMFDASAFDTFDESVEWDVGHIY